MSFLIIRKLIITVIILFKVALKAPDGSKGIDTTQVVRTYVMNGNRNELEAQFYCVEMIELFLVFGGWDKRANLEQRWFWELPRRSGLMVAWSFYWNWLRCFYCKIWKGSFETKLKQHGQCVDRLALDSWIMSTHNYCIFVKNIIFIFLIAFRKCFHTTISLSLEFIH